MEHDFAILIVHDDKDRRAGLHACAVEHGFAEDNIEMAVDDQAAFEAIEQRQFDLAIVDLHLREHDSKDEGLQVIEHLHRKQARCRIIGITYDSKGDGGPRMLQAGADDFVREDMEVLDWLEFLKERLQLWVGVLRKRVQLESVASSVTSAATAGRP